MKAEHRKELETNTLAEGVGHFVQNIKGRPRRATVFYVVTSIGALLAVFFFLRYRQVSNLDAAQRWAEFETQSRTYIDKLAQSAAESNAGKASLLDKSWITLWEEGIKGLGVRADVALPQLDVAAAYYDLAIERCQGDPTMEPEAMFGRAVIEETRALVDVKKLESAKEQYAKLADKHGSSAYGKQAAERAALLSDRKKYKEVEDFYKDLGQRLGLDRVRRPTPQLTVPGKKAPAPVFPDPSGEGP